MEMFTRDVNILVVLLTSVRTCFRLLEDNEVREMSSGARGTWCGAGGTWDGAGGTWGGVGAPKMIL